MCGCESKEAWFDWKQNKITKCSGFECQMSVRPYQTSFHLSSQCCACRTDNDNPVDLENDIRHDVPSARSQSTWNYMYILYRTESLGPEKGLVKGGPGPSCTENRQRKDSHDTSFSSGGGNVQTTGIISQNSKGIPDTRSRSYLETECSTYVLMHEKKMMVRELILSCRLDFMVPLSSLTIY